MNWKELHAAISALGMTQTEIAKGSGVPQPTISQVLSKDPNVSVPRLPTYLALLEFHEREKRKADRQKRKKAEA